MYFHKQFNISVTRENQNLAVVLWKISPQKSFVLFISFVPFLAKGYEVTYFAPHSDYVKFYNRKPKQIFFVSHRTPVRAYIELLLYTQEL